MASPMRILKNGLQARWEAARTEALRRRRSRWKVTEVAQLRPGIYRSLGGGTWARLGTRIPKHLRLTKLVLAETGRERLKVMTRNLILLISVPPIVRPGWSRGGGVDLVVVAHGGSVLAFDTRKSSVVRQGESSPFTASYVQIRSSYAEYVETPAFEVDGPTNQVREAMIEGTHMGLLTGREQITVATRLVHQYTELVAGAAREPDATLADRVTDAVRHSSLPAGLRVALAAGAVLNEIATYPSIPDNLDVCVSNVVVRDSGPVVIDWPPTAAQRVPFPLGPLRILMLSWGPSALPGAFDRGVFDDPLRGLWTAAGRDFDRLPRAELAASWCILDAYLLVALRHGRQLDLARFENACRLTWANWQRGVSVERDHSGAIR